MTTELAVCTRGLTKQFERYLAVNDIDLEIPAGDVYGLIGPNGAGKTTLIRLLAAAEEPTIGEIFINGDRLLLDHTSAHLKRRIGYLPDDFPLYEDLSVWDYLDYFARLYQLKNPLRRRRLHDVLELVSLTHKKNSPIASLSRGMKQRLSLARTIIHEPLLLLLDEPVSGLDPIARQQFREVIRALQDVGMTVLISSHVLSDLAELCNAIGIMELGCLVESASLSALYQKFSRQVIEISSSGDLEALERELQRWPNLEDCRRIPETQTLEIHFSGTTDDSAALLRSLMELGLPIYNFHCTQENLEDIFLKLGHQQTS